jgi:ribonuclease VapC
VTIFVDASALVCMLALEPGHEELGSLLDEDARRITSPIACWEAAVAFARLREIAPEEANSQIGAFLTGRGIKLVSISDAEGRGALEAFATYGKGRHRAGLNMGDCFAYACAKANDARLLYIGDDFSKTDLA